MARTSYTHAGTAVFTSESCVAFEICPVAAQIIAACEKVLALDINSPLMKVLAGLEYILKKSQVQI